MAQLVASMSGVVLGGVVEVVGSNLARGKIYIYKKYYNKTNDFGYSKSDKHILDHVRELGEEFGRSIVEKTSY